MDFIPKPEFTQLLCDRVQFIVSQAYALSALSQSRMESTAWLDMRLKALVAQLTVEMPGVLKERLTIDRQWPADWWQAVRARWFPGWWLRRWPVKYERIQIDRPLYAAICPHVRTPEPGPHVQWLFEKQQELAKETP